MADLSQPAHPLEARRHGLAVVPDAGVRLRLPAWTGLFQVLAFPDREAVVSQALTRIAEAQELTVRSSLPGEWLVLCASDEAMPPEALGNDAALIDQSHGRVGVLLEGLDVRALLAKGIAIDLHPDAFALGRSVNTMFGHFAVHLTRTSDDTFELIIARSFAGSFFETLVEMGREFGIATA